tara:strand:+ start:12915 stop:13403 length:489 start_codon:yes stop_codon:yes gene_type:complete
MDSELLTWIFLIGGIVLMILETVIPSGTAFVLGFSGVMVGLLRFLGILENPMTATMAWLFISVGLIIMIRPLIKKYFGGDTSFKYADEDYEAMDKVVDVLEPINDEDNSGRIRFQGISWQARTIDGTVPAGTQVKIKYRDNTTWIVEPIDIIEQPISNKLKE